MQDTICAISTPLATGAIGVIRVSGDEAVEICTSVFHTKGKPLSQRSSHTACLGMLMDGKEAVDNCVATVFLAPKSYTGEDTVEFSLHGGLYTMKRALKVLTNAGARLALAGEFTKRAFINGKLDLSQAEAVIDIINATGKLESKVALNNLSGRVSDEIKDIYNKLMMINARFLVTIDYPDEDIDELERESQATELKQIKARLSRLVLSAEDGKIIKDGVKTAIIGKPNVGKSSVMNCLCGYDKAIVTEIAGTTRDVINEYISLGNVKLNLFDTAGIHQTSDKIESIGIEKTKATIDQSQLILFVADSSVPLDEKDSEIISLLGDKKAVLILNKSDMPQKADVSNIKDKFVGIVNVSAKNNNGFDNLSDLLDKTLLSDAAALEQSVVITSARQAQAVKSACDSITNAVSSLENNITQDAICLDIDLAISALCEITGTAVSEQVTNKIFENFCVGK